MLTGSRKILAIFLLVFAFLAIAKVSVAHAQMIPVPNIEMNWEETDSPQKVATTMQILILITILSLAPAIIIMTTSFTRIVIVLSFLRHALGTQQIPPNPVLLSFALFLTFLTMFPTFRTINDEAIQPYMQEQITQKEALTAVEKPLRKFMFKYTREKDLELFLYASDSPRPKTPEDINTMILIPSFVLSELRTAFTMGFALFITFLVIDLVVASVLMSIGMFMLPPMMISLPIKIMIFVLVDGWYLVVRSIIMSFR
ncbi:MAG: flagellar type III secretion system pore protein FliP [Vulcanimicrobiota bacterium]